jgi:hypothetical protein
MVIAKSELGQERTCAGQTNRAARPSSGSASSEIPCIYESRLSPSDTVATHSDGPVAVPRAVLNQVLARVRHGLQQHLQLLRASLQGGGRVSGMRRAKLH